MTNTNISLLNLNTSQQLVNCLPNENITLHNASTGYKKATILNNLLRNDVVFKFLNNVISLRCFCYIKFKLNY